MVDGPNTQGQSSQTAPQAAASTATTASVPAASVKKTDESAPVYIHGSAGGNFSIEGPGLGTKGTLLVGGQPVEITRWEDRTIRGVLPANAAGEVTLTLADGSTRRGKFPWSPAAVAAAASKQEQKK